MYGKVVDAVTKKPLAGAKLQAWEASTNGKRTSAGKAVHQGVFDGTGSDFWTEP